MQVVKKGAEVKLVETLAELKENHHNHMVVEFAFSKLMEQYRNDYQLKIAINMLNDLLKSEDVSLFLCGDATIYLVCQSPSQQVLDKAVFQLRYLFMDDPLAYTVEGEENPDFSNQYDLETDYENFAAIARHKMLGGKRKQSPRMPKKPGEPIPVDQEPKAKPQAQEENAGFIKQVTKQIASAGQALRNLNASSLANIERDLHNADLSNVVRRQPICASIPDMMVRRVFDELYINIAHLRQMLHVDADLLSNRWLFKYLTELLDERMLQMICHDPSRYLELPISLNLNIRTLLSDSFLEFDEFVKPSVKVSVVIELQVSDVFEDMRAFNLAREQVQKLGYRVCLDGITDLSFVQVDREKLGFDLIKLQWNADMPTDLQTKRSGMIADTVKKCGPNRVILTRCDNRKAVDYGQAMGISLFQGRYLDKLMNPLAKVQN